MQHFYQNIQGWSEYGPYYADIVNKLKDGDTIVEVGSWKGRSTVYMAVEIINSGKNIKFYAVDTFTGSAEHNPNDFINDAVYVEFMKNIEPVKDIITVIRKPSIEASALFKNNELAFVFLDAAHDYDNVKKDIAHWYPKVKTGSIIAGHDYDPGWVGVIKAVDEQFKNKRTLHVDHVWEMIKDS